MLTCAVSVGLSGECPSLQSPQCIQGCPQSQYQVVLAGMETRLNSIGLNWIQHVDLMFGLFEST